MQTLRSPLSRWLARRMLSRSVGGRGRTDLSKVGFAPKWFVMPFARNGLDPVAEIARRRGTKPVSKLSRVFGMNVWLVTGHEQAKAVLADSARFSNDIRPLVASAGSSDAHSIGGLGLTDPPDHTRLRKLLTPEFTMRRLARIEPLIDQIVEEQLDAVERAGPVADLVTTFAFPVPFRMICELLGLTVDDQDQFRELGRARFDISTGGVGLFGAASQSREFLLDVVSRQRSAPGPGLIGAIIREQGEAISDLELGGLADGVFTGGYETSVSMLALGSLVLAQNPATLQQLRDDPSCVDGVVHELLRYLTVVQMAFPRFAREDLDLFGQRIAAGDVVLCSLSGANRDTVFGERAEEFDPSRAGASAHLGFGYGLHRCVGAELARMELRAAFLSLARRFPDLSLAVPVEQLEFRQMSVVYGVEALPVRLRPEAVRLRTA